MNSRMKPTAPKQLERLAKDPSNRRIRRSEETRHILVDYIGLLNSGSDGSVARRAPSAKAVNF